MKMFIKTVCITLCISVTALFFSSYKRVEAVAVTTASAAVVAIGSIIVAVATYFAIDNIPDIQSYVKSSSFESSITTDEDGIAIFNPSSGLPATVNPNIFNALSNEAVKAHNQHLYLYTHTSSSGGEHGGGGNHRIPPSLYEAAVTAAIAGIIASEVLFDSSSEDNPGSIPSGAASGIITGISNANGKPQKVTTSYEPTTVDIFEYFDIEYVTYNSITDFYLYADYKNGINVENLKYYLPFVIKDGNLYGFCYNDFYNTSPILFYTTSQGLAYFKFSNITLTQGSTGGAHISAVRFSQVDGRLCLAAFNYHSSGYPKSIQKIYGYPVPSSVPILFETPQYDSIEPVVFEFNNYDLEGPLYFVNLADNSDVLSESDILSSNFDTCGYIKSTNTTFLNFNGTVGTAATTMSGTEGSVVSGGTKTTYSDLSDIEKAIYTLAQQQGITYEEMLNQCNILINENGEMYLESLDGVTQSIDSLLSEFDKLVEQGEITIEQGTETIAQLKAILSYLQSLNIEGANEYISQIQDTLNDLNASEKDRAAVLGEVLEQIQGLNDYLDSLGLKDTVKDISDIQTKTEVISDILEEIKQGQDEDKRKAQTLAGGILVPLPTDFKLYNQCKLLLDNLFNYDDIVIPPDFAFFWDSNNDGISERYVVLDLSFLETKLTNENLADKSWFIDEIKVIDFIRYLIALYLYGLFVMRLIKRLPTFYGSGVFSRIKG